VEGYGPLRLQYLVEMGRALSQMLTDLDDARTAAAGQSQARDGSLDASRTLRRRALRALENLAGARPEEAVRARKATRTHLPQADERRARARAEPRGRTGGELANRRRHDRIQPWPRAWLDLSTRCPGA
jgi:hypothetical protein